MENIRTQILQEQKNRILELKNSLEKEQNIFHHLIVMMEPKFADEKNGIKFDFNNLTLIYPPSTVNEE